MLRWPSFNNFLILSFLLRVGLIVYSEYYDALPSTTVKYTDIDYKVFTDAARYLLTPNEEHGNVARGVLGRKLGLGDPYTRPTYRYTPLLAVLMTPNILLHPAIGKLLFATSDILMALILFSLAQKAPNKESANIRITLLHLLNPLIFSISTRGSSESVLGLFVLATLYYATQRRWDAAAVWFGLAVHWKIYPIVYGSSLLMLLGVGRKKGDWAVRARARFALIAAATFGLVGGAMYAIWGQPFLEHTYLYHLTRKDYKHNFSPYFYPTYLSLAKNSESNPNPNLSPGNWGWSMVSNPLMSFLPQMILSIGSGFILPTMTVTISAGPSPNPNRIRNPKPEPNPNPKLTVGENEDRSVNVDHLAFVWFVQTVTFVAFNKVCTSQYFLWYIWFLPLIIPRLGMSLKEGMACIAVYVLSQAVWLSLAYRLEFLGENVFFEVWLASLGVFGAQVGILFRMVKAYQFR